MTALLAGARTCEEVGPSEEKLDSQGHALEEDIETPALSPFLSLFLVFYFMTAMR